MASAIALAIFSGKIILNFAFVALCGALQTLFSREGSWRETAEGVKTKRTSSEEPVRHGRGSKFRTHGTRFWRPLLYQLSYTPICIR